MKDNKGYTLIELIIVIAIIAIVAGSLVFGISMIFTTDAKGCANKLKTGIGRTKIATMGKQEAYLEVYKSAADGFYYLVLVENGDTANAIPQRITKRSTTTIKYIGKTTSGDLTGDMGAGVRVTFNRESGKRSCDVEKFTVTGGGKTYTVHITVTGKVVLE